MSDLHLPVRPDLDQLKRQAKELLHALQIGEAHPHPEVQKSDRAGQVSQSAIEAKSGSVERQEPNKSATIRLADAQRELARRYGASNWARLAQACRLVEAIWNDDVGEVRSLVAMNPRLIHEFVLIRDRNWGPPMSYAANIGRDEIIRMLHETGAKDHDHAFGRAVLQGRIETARLLRELMESPPDLSDALSGPAYTLNEQGTAYLLELGACVCDADGKRRAPVDVVLESDSRKPAAKHAILEMYVKHGLALPDTPTMAVHRGRIDLLEAHLRRDPGMLTRTFAHEEIYPPELGCHDEVLATHGTPLKGATLLHMCVDYDELEIARWLLDRGMDVNVRAAVDAEGFGGHTALFATVVSQPNFWTNRDDSATKAPFAALLLERGADPNVRASLRKQLHPGYGEQRMHEHRDVTALSWGRRFHDRRFVSAAAMELIEKAGGGG